MIKTPSFEKINYLLRPHKQIERRMIIDLLSTINLSLPIYNYHYVGMGSIYYYDYILLHKHLNIRTMTSIDKEVCVNRFRFNKPYDFVNFENCATSDYLFRHKFVQGSLFWLDYDGALSGNDFLKKDISILGKNCVNEDLYFVTVNCEAPVKDHDKRAFITEFKNYLPASMQDVKNIIPSKFPFVVQEIILNMLAESTEYNDNKFLKLSSFIYRDGVLMYTLCGIFLQDANKFSEKQINEKIIQNDRNLVTTIKVPHLTYKEKFYMDENISSIENLLKYSKDYWETKGVEYEVFESEMDAFLAKELQFELSYKDVANYIKNYRFVPQYYETVI